MRTRTPLAALAATLAALALGAPTAGAAEATRIDYAVTIEGTADYNRADVDAEASAQHDETIDFRTAIPRLSFIGNAAEDSTGALGTASVRRGSFTMTGPSGIFLHCSSHTLLDTTGGGLDATFAPDKTVFATRVLDAFKIQVGGCPNGLGPWEYTFGSGADPVGVGIFDGTFSVPHSRIGEAEMTFPLKGEVTGSSCPNHHFNTALCSLTWEATVTFKRTGEGVVDDEIVPVPIEPKPAEPAPRHEPAPPAEHDDLIVPIVAKASLAPSLARASVPFTCEAACRGTLIATARGKAKPLARATFSAAASRAARVTVRFDRADKRAIRRARGVRLTLTATAVKGGAPDRRSLVLRLR